MHGESAHLELLGRALAQVVHGQPLILKQRGKLSQIQRQQKLGLASHVNHRHVGVYPAYQRRCVVPVGTQLRDQHVRGNGTAFIRFSVRLRRRSPAQAQCVS